MIERTLIAAVRATSGKRSLRGTAFFVTGFGFGACVPTR
jgi:hypothetical protein